MKQSFLFCLLCIVFSLTMASNSLKAANWYYKDWMYLSPYSPVFKVLDTESSLGPLAKRSKIITLRDLIKMHGHPCDGLFTAACALSVGLNRLFPEGVIDRTDLRCITNNSPCYGDVTSYLTGARIRFGTQKIDPNMKNEWIVQRVSTDETIRIRLREGVFPLEISALEKTIKSGNYKKQDIRRCQKMQWNYARNLLQKPLKSWFDVTKIPNIKWVADDYVNIGKRGDVLLKDALKGK